MRLSAIFIKGHWLFENDQVINFGGKNIYDFNLNENILEINKTENLEFIEGFYGENISLLSAIVGSNGAGKTSLLNTILLNITDNNVGTIDCDFIIFIYEDTEIVKYFYKDYSKINHTINPINFELSALKKDFSTFFYTPVLDVRQFYIDHTRSHYFDLSKYRFWQNDTESEKGGFTELSEYHLSENLKRWIQFNNNFNLNIDYGIDDIPKFESIKIVINKVSSLLNDYDDVSRDFIPFGKDFYEKWGKEYNQNTNIGKLKLNLILAVIEKVFLKLEKTGNRYLNEGKLKIKVKDIKNSNLIDSFYSFLDNHYFTEINSDTVNTEVRLPVKEIKDLIEILLDNLPDESDIQKNRWQEYSVDFETSAKIIDVYNNFLKAFSSHFTLDKTILLTFKPNIELSSGEKGLLDLFSSFFSIKNEGLSENVVVFLDEGDTFFHPNWKIKFVNLLVKILPVIFENKKIQIIFTTHDPLSLSDIPNKNTVYLKDKNILSEEEKPKKSFGANITDLLADSFFVEDGLIGDFAKEKIGITLEWLKKQGNKKGANFSPIAGLASKIPQFENETEEKDYHKKVIKLIDEPIVQNKLKEMFIEFVSEDFEFKNEQIRNLEDKLRKLKGQ